VNHRVILIDGPMLAELMMDYDLGVSTKEGLYGEAVDSDYLKKKTEP